jgi:ComF family protein
MVSPCQESGTIDLLQQWCRELIAHSLSQHSYHNYSNRQGFMGNWLKNWGQLLNLVLESPCPLCQRSTPRPLCLNCEQQLQHCRLSHPSESWQKPLPVFAWGTYGGGLKRAIAALKYHNQPQLAQPLGQWLAQAWRAADLSLPQSSSQSPSQPLSVIPIPLHAAKQQQRGFNQAELLAVAFCQQTGLPIQRHGLLRIRETEALFGLTPDARSQTLEAAFQPSPALLRRPPRAVLLLDDIYTTGATVRSAAQVLRRHQISVVGVVAIAKTGKHLP